jgi:carbamoyl-phosphate synthase large subunit
MLSTIRIGVTGTGSLIGQAVIKSVQRSDLANRVEFIGFDYFQNTVGSFWCKKNYLLPDILKKEVTEEQWIDTIIDYLNKESIQLLFVGVDFELPILAKYKSKIESQTKAKVIVSDESVIEIGDDKYLTYEFLKSNGLYYPKSYLPEGWEKEELDFPVILKPRNGARSVGVSIIKNKAELKEKSALLNLPVVQELVGTDDTEFTCGVICFDGELKQSIALRRTLKAGNTYLSYYQKDFPEIITQYLKDITSKLKPFGACNFQLRLDKNGIPKMFEINPRHSGTTYIRSLFGYKEIEYMIRYLIDQEEMLFQLQEGTVVRYYDEFFIPNPS